jgi:hypothetical protein
MPGIYVNDGGATSSAIGNALGGLATDFSPETAAKAKLLWLQSEGVDISNQAAIDKYQAMNNASNLSDAIINYTNGGTGGDGSVPTGALPAPWHDAGGRTANLVAPKSLMGALLASRQEQGGDANDIGSVINLSQQANPAIGPGGTFSVQGDVSKARQMPPTLSPGQVQTPGRNLDGSAAPGATLSGGSTTSQQVQNDTAKQATAEAASGPAAQDAIATLAQLQALRKEVVGQGGSFSTADVAYQEIAKRLDDASGSQFFTRLNNQQDVLDAINKRMKSITAATRLAYAGDPTMRGLAQQLDEGLPNPASGEFDASVNALKKALQAQADDAAAANDFLKTPDDPAAAQAYRAGKLARHEAARQQIEDTIKAGSETPPPVQTPPPPVQTPPPPVPAGPPVKHYKWNSQTHRSELIPQ